MLRRVFLLRGGAAVKNVFISERLAQELPEWVPYLLWYAVADLNTPATTVPVGRANGAVKPLK